MSNPKQDDLPNCNRGYSKEEELQKHCHKDLTTVDSKKRKHSLGSIISKQPQ